MTQTVIYSRCARSPTQFNCYINSSNLEAASERTNAPGSSERTWPRFTPPPKKKIWRISVIFFFKVIVIDWNANSVALNRQNALLLPKWEGDNTDRHLIGLAQLLQGS